jgi:AP-1 complex subunit gamma-1
LGSSRIRSLIETYKTSIIVELQQRSCEYSSLLNTLQPQYRSVVLERMPAMEDVRESITQEAPAPSNSRTAAASSPAQTHAAPPQDLLADIFAPSATTAAPAAARGAAATDLLSDIFGGGAPPAPAANLGDIFGGGGLAPSGAALGLAPTPAGGYAPITVYSKDGLQIKFELQKQLNNPSLSTINVSITNSTPQPINNFIFSAAVPKYIKLQLGSPSSSIVPPHNSGSVTQQIKLANTLQGQKPVLMKIKIEFLGPAGPFSDLVDVTNFPPNF